MIKCPSCQAEVSDTSHFCSSCGEPLELQSTAPTWVGAKPEPAGGAASAGPSFSGASLSLRLSSDSGDESRFIPGTVLANRYRIVGLLGRGGMGEVYRADDLKLGQAVALKLLPEVLETHDGRLSLLLAEVRNARQVSHPNVCRVYDIGEVDGRHYLSMEYIDGEDLGSLLKRIGRLSEEKAVQIARQLCAGLAAIHDQGILHRDLKPSNVMIDGRGRVRVTDFGLAAAAGEAEPGLKAAGTPAYMSPEQLAGNEPSEKSDIYALGLVLYELFTGKPTFKASTVAELKRLQHRPSSPAALVKGLDPVVEKVILRCLEQDPEKRPATALSVAAALPGGDPLAAALAAGDTPLPEMVAAAGEVGGLRPARAVACLAALLVLALGLVFLVERIGLAQRVGLEKRPGTLAFEARGLIEDLGYDEPPADSASGFGVFTGIAAPPHQEATSGIDWKNLDQLRPGPIYFWYRQSPQPLIPENFVGSVTLTDPAARRPNMIQVQLDPQGRLLHLLAIPPEFDDSEETGEEPNWSNLFKRAELGMEEFSPMRPVWNPPIDCDSRKAWTGSYPGQPDVEVRVEAGSYRGKPAYFQVIAPWTRPTPTDPTPQSYGSRVAYLTLLGTLLLLIAGAVFLARRNLRHGRGDRRGALRLGAYVFAITLLTWLLRIHHVSSPWELALICWAVQVSLFLGALVWLLYIAIEPYIRRLWPHTLISWNRLLGGQVRDPMVGRDLLIGAVAGLTLALVLCLSVLGADWLAVSARPPILFPSEGLSRLRGALSLLVNHQADALVSSMSLLLLILLLRILVRKQWLAIGLTFLLFSLIEVLNSTNPALEWVFAMSLWATVAFVLARFGLLAAVLVLYYVSIPFLLPITSDLSAWYVGYALLSYSLPLGLAIYGFYTSLAGRPLLGDELLAE